jgi:hypothetical protein
MVEFSLIYGNYLLFDARMANLISPIDALDLAVHANANRSKQILGEKTYGGKLGAEKEEIPNLAYAQVSLAKLYY